MRREKLGRQTLKTRAGMWYPPGAGQGAIPCSGMLLQARSGAPWPGGGCGAACELLNASIDKIFKENRLADEFELPDMATVCLTQLCCAPGTRAPFAFHTPSSLPPVFSFLRYSSISFPTLHHSEAPSVAGQSRCKPSDLPQRRC